MTRRALLARGAHGLGAVALTSLLARESPAQTSMGRAPHSAPRARRVIYLFQHGGPSHVDLFDYKPELARMHGQPVPPSFVAGRRFSSMTGSPVGRSMWQPIRPFRRHGQCGARVSELLPRIGSQVDDLCFIKSMHTDSFNHSPAILLLLTGAQQPGRASMGSWLHYGLGSENNALPTFVVLTSVSGGSCDQLFNDAYWSSGFLPSRFQGVPLRSGGDPVLYLANPEGISRGVRRSSLDDIGRLNAIRQRTVGDPEIAARTSQYEAAFRMQASVPELVQCSGERRAVLDRYGPDVERPGSYAYNCLLARRLAERGVRFIQIMHAGWDHHADVRHELPGLCRDTDAPTAALLEDLKQRGLLDDTLVVWGGEFGRTPFRGDFANGSRRDGRDHHPYAFTVWLAGAGVRPGFTFGLSDELAMNVAEDAVHVHDLQATILHLVGIDHQRLTFRHEGRDIRLTDVGGSVVEAILQ